MRTRRVRRCRRPGGGDRLSTPGGG